MLIPYIDAGGIGVLDLSAGRRYTLRCVADPAYEAAQESLDHLRPGAARHSSSTSSALPAGRWTAVSLPTAGGDVTLARVGEEQGGLYAGSLRQLGIRRLVHAHRTYFSSPVMLTQASDAQLTAACFEDAQGHGITLIRLSDGRTAQYRVPLGQSLEGVTAIPGTPLMAALVHSGPAVTSLLLLRAEDDGPRLTIISNTPLRVPLRVRRLVALPPDVAMPRSGIELILLAEPRGLIWHAARQYVRRLVGRISTYYQEVIQAGQASFEGAAPFAGMPAPRPEERPSRRSRRGSRRAERGRLLGIQGEHPARAAAFSIDEPVAGTELYRLMIDGEQLRDGPQRLMRLPVVVSAIAPGNAVGLSLLLGNATALWKIDATSRRPKMVRSITGDFRELAC